MSFLEQSKLDFKKNLLCKILIQPTLGQKISAIILRECTMSWARDKVIHYTVKKAPESN